MSIHILMQQDYSVHTDTGRVPHSHWGESGSGRTFLRELREFTRMNPASDRATEHLDTDTGPPEDFLSPRPGSGERAWQRGFQKRATNRWNVPLFPALSTNRPTPDPSEEGYLFSRSAAVLGSSNVATPKNTGTLPDLARTQSRCARGRAHSAKQIRGGEQAFVRVVPVPLLGGVKGGFFGFRLRRVGCSMFDVGCSMFWFRLGRAADIAPPVPLLRGVRVGSRSQGAASKSCESCFKSIRVDSRNSRKAVPTCIGADPKICTRITRIHANESCFKSIRVDSRNSRKGVPTPHSQLSRTLHAAHPNEAQSEP